MADETPAPVTVTDRRTPPRGVLPRGAQTWLMAGLAAGILGVILITGRPEPPTRRAEPASSAAATSSPERLREYQDRLRLLEERGREQVVSPPSEIPTPLLYDAPGGSAASVDPLHAEKQRRDYESLFAPNLVSSRRTGRELTDPNAITELARSGSGSERDPLAPPSLDEVAEAVMRATARTQGAHLSASVPEPTTTAVPRRRPRAKRLA